MNSNSIPIDLIIEIFSRLSLKSVARFRCLSKLWASILDRPYFKELFLTKSSTQPRLLFAIEDDGVWSFFSLPQRHNPYEKSSSSSLVVTAEFHMKFPPDNMKIYHHYDQTQYFACGYASGLIYFYKMWNKEKHYRMPVICNPTTGRYAALPSLKGYGKSYSFIGFDPIDKQFKVLLMTYPPSTNHHKILTLGTGEMRWREIECSLRPKINSKGICINGVLYFLGNTFGTAYDEEFGDYVIVCFDVRSEKFKFLYVENFSQLINYKGKLGVVHWKGYANLCVWVLEDVEKQEWSKYTYTLRDDKFFHPFVSIIGTTATGEIVFSNVRIYI